MLNNIKKTVIGDVSRDWDVASLGEIASNNEVNSFIDGDWVEARYLATEGIRLIQTGNIGTGNFKDKKNRKYISKESFDELKCKNVFPGDILICRLADPIGRACIVPNLMDELITSVDVTIFRPNTDLYSKEYLNYYINYDKTLQRISTFASGSTRQRISRKNLSTIPIAIPKLKEQQKIAAVLTSVDEAIEKTETIIKQTEKVKEGLMQQLLTKGIGHTEFKNTTIGEVPKDWEVLKLVDIVENKKNAIKPGPFGSSLKKEFYVERGHKVYGQEQVIPDNFTIGNYYINQDKFEELKAFEVKPGDLLISLVGTFGKIAIVPEDYEPGIINPRLLKISFEKSKAVVKFYKYYMSSSPFYNQLSGLSQGGTMGVINSKTMKSLFFPCPPVEEQYKIIEVLHSFDAKLHNERQRAESLKLLKEGLMQDLLTGKVRVKVDETEVVSS